MNKPTDQHHLNPAEQHAANALVALSNGTVTDSRLAFEALAKRNRELLEGGTLVIRESLAQQVALLEVVTFNLFEDAATASSPKAVTLALSYALTAQKALLRTLGALHQVSVSNG